MLRRLRQLDGAIVFVIVTVALTLISAVIFVPAIGDVAPDVGAMVRASILYVAVVGWQPLVAFAVARRWFADRRTFDDGIRPVAMRDCLFAVALAMFVLGVAVIFDPIHPDDAQPVDISALGLARLVIAFLAMIAVLWLQALVEELAWRSYVLPRLMRVLGAWPGLIVHGVIWGLCYAPLFAVAGASVARSLTYVVTSALLGIVLGWVRLATRSIYASAASNATLTICAGLPLVLVGGSSRFSAAFEPPGWLPLVIVVLLIVGHRPWRTAIAIPWRRLPEHVN